MSAADEALQECSVCHGTYPYPVELNHDEAECDTFMAGYRRALLDAAKEIPGPVESPPAQWLLARAAAVAPRETKD